MYLNFTKTQHTTENAQFSQGLPDQMAGDVNNCQIVNVTSVGCGNSDTLKHTCQPQSLGPIPWPGVNELIERQ